MYLKWADRDIYRISAWPCLVGTTLYVPATSTSGFLFSVAPAYPLSPLPTAPHPSLPVLTLPTHHFPTNSLPQTTFDELSTSAHDEPGILKSRDFLSSLIAAEAKNGIPTTRVVLGGFSQGGAMALFTGLTGPHHLAGFFGLSSYLLMGGKVKDLVQQAKSNTDVPVFMGHGDRDPLVKYEWGVRTAKAMEDMGWKVDFRTYKGLVHSAAPEEIDDLERYIALRLPVEAGAGRA